MFRRCLAARRPRRTKTPWLHTLYALQRYALSCCFSNCIGPPTLNPPFRPATQRSSLIPSCTINNPHRVCVTSMCAASSTAPAAPTAHPERAGAGAGAGRHTLPTIDRRRPRRPPKEVPSVEAALPVRAPRTSLPTARVEAASSRRRPAE